MNTVRGTVCGALLSLLVLVGGTAGGCFAKQLYGELDQWAMLCNAAGIKLQGANVEKVMLGTPAYFSGLRAGDKVLKCDVVDKTMKITFDRAGKHYAVSVPTEAAAFQAGLETKGQKSPKTFVGEAQALQKLRDFDVIVFLDCSGSMGEDIRSERMRKWDWARTNIKNFSAKYNSAVKRPITLVVFNDKFNIIPNARPEDLARVFDQRSPDGGTDLASPLESVIGERLNALEQRPCVIVVLHDGISDNELRVQQILERTAQHVLGANKIFVTFIQIGDDAMGTENLKTMEAANAGGKDIVKTELFQDIEKQGLASVIADAIKDHLPQDVVKPTRAALTQPAKTPRAQSGTGRSVPAK
jgi:hypothetical protein